MSKKRILGIDTGTNSLGWAVVDREDDGSYSLVRKGVLLFQEGVKTEKGIESSKAAERTGHRALRRQYFRRRLRKIEVLKVLVKHNLCPALSEDDLKLWHTRKIYPRRDEFMLWQRTDDKEDRNPYHDRYVCLTEKLDLTREKDRFILGRAMYHLAQRRGFRSNRLDESDDKETGAVKEGIAALTKEMEAKGCHYLGEYFYKLYKEEGGRERIRTRYIDREEHYEHEFKAICQRQELSEELQRALSRALYFQRPLKSQRQGVGKCTQEKKKPRCPISHPLFEEYRKLGFLNNVRIRTPYDMDFRSLSEEERAKTESLFYRKSKPDFDFEEIAKAIAGKNKYMSKGEVGDKPYVFNYRMSQNVSGCPVTAQLKGVFGDDWINAIAETYAHSTKKDGTLKTPDEMVNDIWNVLFFFDSKDKLVEFAEEQLQLDAEKAKKFSEIRLGHDYSSLSIKAIRNILPFLRMGMITSHATFMGNIPSIVGEQVWNDEAQRKHIILEVEKILSTPKDEDKGMTGTYEFCIKRMLMEEYGITEKAVKALYHPSMIETYPDARPDEKTGEVLLGSPMTNAVRNPMAMRSLHEVRKVVNSLIKEGVVSPATEVHIEYARELNDANKRKAINDIQRGREKKAQSDAAEIKRLYKENTGRDIEPTPTDILKYQLWEEQGKICLYTGESIGIHQFLGDGPVYDIEHTIPRSVGGDSTRENLTLCSSHFNRYVKKTKLPSELGCYDAILERIQPWKERYEELTKQIDKFKKGRSADKSANDTRIQKIHRLREERDYLRGKYMRFMMTEVPEGFARRQGAGIGLISKYAGLFLKSYFHDSQNPDKRQIYTVKGPTTAEFRRMWGLQEDYEKKSRDNHVHHCMDAIVIACIGKRQYDLMAQYYKAEEEFRWGEAGDKPQFEKPWPTFTEDVKALADELLVVHDTKDNTIKQAKKRVRTATGKHVTGGDSIRGSLHMDTYYGAIEREGEICYVVRRSLDSMDVKDVKNIVDDAVRAAVEEAISRAGSLKDALKNGIKLGGKTPIRKVRCYAKDVQNPLSIRTQRDRSNKEYKQQYHVKNDGNYMIGIYEGLVKGKTKRDFTVLNMLDVARKMKTEGIHKAEQLLPQDKDGKPLIYSLKIGQHVLLLDKSEDRNSKVERPQDRLYVVTGLSTVRVQQYSYGSISLRYASEARKAGDLKYKNGEYKIGEEKRPAISIYHTQISALVEGKDFILSPLGEIIYLYLN